MASFPHSPVTFTGNSASDLFRSSIHGGNGSSFKLLGRTRLGAAKKDFVILSKIKKGKRKHDYPWPRDADPNVEGGILTHLSSFKPLKQAPKPVTLEFEKPLVDLEKKIDDVRKMANKTGLDFTEQITSLENKYHQALKDLYTNLTPIQRVNIARHPNRPTFLDHMSNITDKFVELHGDRAGYDDPAIVTGLGSIDGRSFMFMGHQKGRNTKEHIKRNFGMPTPHGYRKALRMMYYADHHGFPIVTFIDTPGAFADLKSEELGQGEAIAHNLRSMFGLKVPVISIVIGEGGSGGALALGCANKLLMLENAVFYVASPEACAAILWKSAKEAPKAAEMLKITAPELCRLKIADGIIPEPLGGAHVDPKWTSQQIKAAILKGMDGLEKLDTPKLLHQRMLKFRHIGYFGEPKKKKPLGLKGNISSKTEVNVDGKEKSILLNEKISKTTKSSPKLAAVENLKQEVDREFSKAVESMGLKEKLEMLRKENKERRSPDQLIDPGLKDKVDKLTQEFNQRLTEAPNYTILTQKLNMLQEAQAQADQSHKVTLKQKINRRFKEVLDRPDLKAKIEALKADCAKAGVSLDGDLDHELKERRISLKKEIEFELADTLKSLNLDVGLVPSKEKDVSEQAPPSEFKGKIEELNKEIEKKMKDVITSTDFKIKIELLKAEVAKMGESPDPESKSVIENLKQQIKQNMEAAVISPTLIEKHEKLMEEISQYERSSAELDESLKNNEPRFKANVGASKGGQYD